MKSRRKDDVTLGTALVNELVAEVRERIKEEAQKQALADQRAAEREALIEAGRSRSMRQRKKVRELSASCVLSHAHLQQSAIGVTLLRAVQRLQVHNSASVSLWLCPVQLFSCPLRLACVQHGGGFNPRCLLRAGRTCTPPLVCISPVLD